MQETREAIDLSGMISHPPCIDQCLGHPEDRTTQSVLRDGPSSGLLEPREFPGSITPQPRQHYAEHAAAIGIENARGQNVDARLIDAFSCIPADTYHPFTGSRLQPARRDIDNPICDRIAVLRFDYAVATLDLKAPG